MALDQFLAEVVPVRQKLYRFAYRLLDNEADAEDITQDALLKVWDMGERMYELQNMEAWCMRITRNLALDKIRSRKRRKVEELDRVQQWPAAGQQNPHDAAALNDVMKKVHKAIDALPEKYRTVLQLRDIDGLSYQDIAYVLDIQLSEVKVNLQRARKTVRLKLQNIEAHGL